MNKLQALVFLFAQQSQDMEVDADKKTQIPLAQLKLIRSSEVKETPPCTGGASSDFVKTANQNNIDTPKQRIQTSLKQLAAQAEKINQLSAELEEAIGKLKAIATDVNQDSRFFRLKQRNAKRFDICEYRSVYLPIIRQKSGGRLVLTSRSLDLSKNKCELS